MTRPLVDNFGRRISYVRLSVTDRCDLRCRYCMPEHMSFMPRKDLLSFEEIEALTDILIERGVTKIRLTGGEPLIRRGILDLVAALGTRLGRGLDELTLTTNGSQLANAASSLRQSGVRRINVSLDSLDHQRFREITRFGHLDRVLDGIAAAKDAGLRIKINMVALDGLNDREIETMMRWCARQGHDLTIIETMPLGNIGEDRAGRFLPLDQVRSGLEQKFTLIPRLEQSGGPARYVEVAELRLRLGFITPLTNNFCAGCNRIRITATGTVFACLGHNENVELRELLRSGGTSAVEKALDGLMSIKPQRHDFDIRASEPAVRRHMSVTGG